MNNNFKKIDGFNISKTKIYRGIPFMVDENPALKYEKTELIYYVYAPFMFLLGIWVLIKRVLTAEKLTTNTFWFDGISSVCREIKETAQGWRAVDILYNYKFNEIKGFSGFMTDFWLRTINSQAMRNRLKLVKQCLRVEIEKLSGENEIRIFSIASGSAQAVVEVMGECKQKGVDIRACLLDMDAGALEHSKKLAREVGVAGQIQYFNKSARESENLILKFDPHIIEVVGFLEYRPKARAMDLITRIHRLMRPEAVFLTSTITPNVETFFLHWVVSWPMIYRTPKQFAELLSVANFADTKVICEPLEIQKIAICRKQ